MHKQSPSSRQGRTDLALVLNKPLGVPQDIGKAVAKYEELQDSLNYIQNAIFKGNEKMEQFKLQLEWNQNDLETWALAQKQKEEDNLAMQKYTRADETRIKELTLQIEKLTERVSTTKRALEDEVTETQAKQIELDKTAEEFRKLHRERQDLVKQWEDAIKTMQKRDMDIQQAQEKFIDAKADYDIRKQELEDHERFLEVQVKENEQADNGISIKERQVGKLREQWASRNGIVQKIVSEIDVLKNQLGQAASDLVSFSAKREAQEALIEERKKALEIVRQEYAKVRRKLGAAAKEKLRLVMS